MRPDIAGVLVLVTCGIAPAIAAAQDARGAYVLTGFGMTWRESLVGTSRGTSVESAVPSLVFGVGTRVRSWLGIEGTAELHSGQSIPWRYDDYLVAGQTTKEITTDRDLPIIGAVRLSPRRCLRICPEVVAGGGISLHIATSVSTGQCGTLPQPFPECLPLLPHGSDDRSFNLEGLGTLAGGVAIRVSARVTLSPGVRWLIANRAPYPTGYLDRGPHNSRGTMI